MCKGCASSGAPLVALVTMWLVCYYWSGENLPGGGKNGMARYFFLDKLRPFMENGRMK